MEIQETTQKTYKFAIEIEGIKFNFNIPAESEKDAIKKLRSALLEVTNQLTMKI